MELFHFKIVAAFLKLVLHRLRDVLIDGVKIDVLIDESADI